MEGREPTKRTLFQQGESSEESETSVVSNHSTEAPWAEETTSSEEEMDALFLDAGVLMLHRLYRGDIYNIRDRHDLDGENRNLAEDKKSFRHAAYRQFILWQHGPLGHGNRRVIPSCCTLRIRRQYPDPMGHYVGFRLARLD